MSNAMTTLGALMTYTPSGGALVQASPGYQMAVQDFKRGTGTLLTLNDRGAEVPAGVDATVVENIGAITTFIGWVRNWTPAQWSEGVPLTALEVGAACGRNGRPLDIARAACLTVKKKGNRRKGECNTYTLSKPHYLGLAAVLAANAAWTSALAARAMEDAAHAIHAEDALDVTLNPGMYETGAPVQVLEGAATVKRIG